MRIYFIWLLLLIYSCHLSATNNIYEKYKKEIPPSIVIEDTGEVLTLRGVALHKNFFQDSYLAAFYALNPVTDAKQALEDTGAKRMLLYFLHSMDNFSAICSEAIEENNAPELIQREQISISQFLKIIDNPLHAGDIVVLDYVPSIGTKIIFKGSLRGTIKGNEFYNLVLKIWLGRQPPSKKFRKDLFNLP